MNFEHIEHFSIRRKGENSKKYSFTGIGIFNNRKFLKEMKTYYGFEEIIKIEKVKQDREAEFAAAKIFIEDNYDCDTKLLKDLVRYNTNKYLIKDFDIDNIIKNLNKVELKERYSLYGNKRRPLWRFKYVL